MSETSCQRWLVANQRSHCTKDACLLAPSCLVVTSFVGCIDDVTPRWAGFVRRCVTVFEHTVLLYFVKPFKPTHPGHPSVARRNEYQRRLRLPVWTKRWILRQSRPCYQDYCLMLTWLKSIAVKRDRRLANFGCMQLDASLNWISPSPA